MARKALQVNTTTGTIERTPDLVEASEVTTIPTLHAIPRADATGKIDAGWVPPLPIAAIPVAEDGEVSSTTVVRADDSRLGNPPVGGDLSGTAGAATVTRIRGRSVASTAPASGQALVWNSVSQQYEPASVGGDAGNATQLQGRTVAATAPQTNDALVWNGTAWAPGAAGGGESSGSSGSVGGLLYLFAHYK